MEKKTKVKSMRLSPGVMNLLETMAEKEHRPVSNMVEWMVMQYAEKNGVTLGSSGRVIGAKSRKARQE